MARVMDDTARAKLLSSLLDQQQGDGSEDPAVATSFPAGAGRLQDEEQINNVMPSNAGMPAPGQMREQQQLQQAPGPQGSMMQPIPGQPGMVAVPAQLAQSVMQMLMQQGSNRAVGQSMGADGQKPMPPQEEEEEA